MEKLPHYPDTRNDPEPYNQNYKDDLRASLQMNAWIMGVIGTWPLKHSGIVTLWYRVLNVICYMLLAFLLIPSSTFIVLEIKDFYNQLKLGSALSFFLMAVMKYCALLLREDDIRRCVDYIENDWRNVKYTEERRIMLENANFGRRLVIACGFFMYGGVLLYFIAIPLSRAKIVEEDGNLTYRRLPFPVPSAILDSRRSPINEIIYVIQMCGGFVAHNITVAACGLAALLVMHACGQLQVLMSWLDHLVDGREGVNDTADERLAMIIQLHVRILNFISLTEELLHEISLIEVVGCTLNICFLGYHLMVEWDFQQPVSGLTYLILLISLTFNIFIFCYIGELLTEQTVKVRESSYMIEWHRLPKKTSLAVILILCMSNATTRLTAGNIIELSIGSFGDVIKSSVAYLNMLRTFTT
ncbi:PREDICTED: odorant receptor 63a-like [Vollenhovia emeryi]|uniref:odorant receptor 63a-like n=1 Tax=Vollenhovia emeryi TaxID=411798 RepID=UPI0005F53321|nr:PREDICTED: odorant receptor 63a-like [Vollenhovia emeryi]